MMRRRSRWTDRALHAACFAWLGAFAATTRAARPPSPGTAPSPSVAWTPPPDAPRLEFLPAKPGPLPPELSDPDKKLTLSQLIDIALRGSSRTRVAWAVARARD